MIWIIVAATYIAVSFLIGFIVTVQGAVEKLSTPQLERTFWYSVVTWPYALAMSTITTTARALARLIDEQPNK